MLQTCMFAAGVANGFRQQLQLACRNSPSDVFRALSHYSSSTSGGDSSLITGPSGRRLRTTNATDPSQCGSLSCLTAAAGRSFASASLLAWDANGKGSNAKPMQHTTTQSECRSPRRQPICSSVDISEIVSRQRGPTGFKVMEFFPNSVAKDWQSPITPQVLGIHPRDLSLFTAGSRPAAQRATITVQDHAIMIKTEAVRAIINADKAVVFKSRSERENQNIIAPMLQAISSQQSQLPFELCAMEVLLHATVMYFERRINHLGWMLDIVMHDLQGKNMQEPFAAVSNESMIQQLVPLDKALMAARNDAKETCAAIQSILNDDEKLAAVCLTEQRNAMAAVVPEECGDGWSGGGYSMQPLQQQQQQQQSQQQQQQQHHGSARALLAVRAIPRHAILQAERMLQSYEREISSVESTLCEMEENLDTTRELWGMKLDSARNHMMLLNLWLSMVAISLMLTTVLPSAYGMNIQHGLEDAKWYFYTVSAVSVAAGVMSYPFMLSYYKRNWKKYSEHELNKVNRLRIVLMQHLDDLDDILEVCDRMPPKVNRTEFATYLRRALPDLRMNRDTLDFLFQQFDINKDGTVSAAELVRKSTRELEALGKVPTHANINSQMMRSTAMADLYQSDDESWEYGGKGRIS